MATVASMRIARLKEQYFKNRPSLCLHRAVAFTQSYKETEGEPTIIRRAKAFRHACLTKPIVIQPHELIVGNPGCRPRSVCVYPDIAWQWLEEELDILPTREQDPYEVTEEQKRVLREEIFPYWRGKSVHDFCLKHLPDDTRELVVGKGLIDNEIKQINGIGHFCPGYQNIVLPKGFGGIKAEAEARLKQLDPSNPGEFDKILFLQAVIIAYDGLILLCKRHAEEARRLAHLEKDLNRKNELEQISQVCEWVAENPPRTFHEALQAAWFMQVALYIETNGPGVSWGRFDQYMYPYYKNDLEAGKLTREQAQELLECLWIKNSELIWLQNTNTAKFFAGYVPFQNLCVGGRKTDGTDATNDLSYMCLEATKHVRLNQPSLSVRLHKGAPEKFFMAVAELVKEGTGFPAIHNDDVGMRMVLQRGATLSDALNWSPMGCVEPLIPGKTHKYSDGGEFNLGAAMEFALTQGRSRVHGLKLGVETPDPKTFQSFEDLMQAVKRQIAHLVYHLAIANVVAEKAHATLLPVPLTSGTVEGCLEKGLDVTAGGALYNDGPGFLGVGIADVGNSLAAIKKLVFDEKLISMDQLLEALEADFSGYEDLRQMLLKAPKWGNGDDYVDSITCEIADFYATEIGKYRSHRGNNLISSLFPVSSNTPLGMVVGALPSGRKAGMPLADGVSPQQGTDRSPTGVLRSVGKLVHERHCNGTLLNMKFNPTVLRGEEGTRNLVALLRTFLDLGCYHIQFNVVSADVLRDAQKHPEKYPGLIVRVAGYSAYFNDLCREIQDDIISRTEHQAI